MVLDTKTNFCLVKRWFWSQKPTFPSLKDGLPEARPKPSFYVGKVGFAMENHLFTRQNQKNHLFQNHPLVKDGFGAHFTSQKDGFPEAVQTKTIFSKVGFPVMVFLFFCFAS